MSDISSYTVLAVLLVLFSSYSSGVFSKKRKYPPGPKPQPIVGNTFQVPVIKTWRYFEKLSRIYGPLVRLSLGGDNIIVLSKPADAEELLTRRGNNYSSRRPLIFAGKHRSNNKRILFLPYGDTLKKHRTAFTQMLNPRVVGGYEVIQELESVQFLYDGLTRPTEGLRHCFRFSASLVFTLSYGKRLGADDEDLDAIIRIVEQVTEAANPGAHLVDTFPVLDYLPDVLAPWRAEARKGHDAEAKLYGRLALEVKEKMDKGNIGLECFAARLWDVKEKMGFDLEEISYIAGTAFEAGTDTTSATLQWFLMLMLLYPETMRKAQAELDAVVGSDGKTMPGFVHLNDLPYCVALTKEVLRFFPVIPGGVPHYSDADDDYKGYNITAKTMIIPNIWSMHRDEDEFQDASKFKPERYMRAGKFQEHDSFSEGHYSFGFGRRKCPGQYLAGKSVWLMITRLMWAFDIKPEHDASGKPIPVDPENCTSGMSSRPEDFPIRLSPRSANHAEVIRSERERLL